MSIDLSGYVEVKDRIVAFREQYPEGTLQAEIVPAPDGFVAVRAYAYRTPDDPTPGTGLAWEPFPGKTPYTRDSELQNAETSAWGRAIIAVGAADASRGIASREEVANRQKDPGDWLSEQVETLAEWTVEQKREAYKAAVEMLAITDVRKKAAMEQIFAHMRGAYLEKYPQK